MCNGRAGKGATDEDPKGRAALTDQVPHQSHCKAAATCWSNSCAQRGRHASCWLLCLAVSCDCSQHDTLPTLSLNTANQAGG